MLRIEKDMYRLYTRRACLVVLYVTRADALSMATGRFLSRRITDRTPCHAQLRPANSVDSGG
jgi:hypothetical protein